MLTLCYDISSWSLGRLFYVAPGCLDRPTRLDGQTCTQLSTHNCISLLSMCAHTTWTSSVLPRLHLGSPSLHPLSVHTDSHLLDSIPCCLDCIRGVLARTCSAAHARAHGQQLQQVTAERWLSQHPERGGEVTEAQSVPKRRRKTHKVKVRKRKSKDRDAKSDLLLKHQNTMFATYA